MVLEAHSSAHNLRYLQNADGGCTPAIVYSFESNRHRSNSTLRIEKYHRLDYAVARRRVHHVVDRKILVMGLLTQFLAVLARKSCALGESLIDLICEQSR